MQTTVVGTPGFEDASVMIESCCSELLRAGFVREAEAIKGAEVYSVDSARAALSSLRDIRVQDESVNSTVRYAMALLETLLKQDTSLPLAS